MTPQHRELLQALVGDRSRLALVETFQRSYPDEHLALLVDLLADGRVKLRVTAEGLSELTKDGLVEVRGVRHVVDCEVVQLAARGARRRGACTCGSVPS